MPKGRGGAFFFALALPPASSLGGCGWGWAQALSIQAHVQQGPGPRIGEVHEEGVLEVIRKYFAKNDKSLGGEK